MKFQIVLLWFTTTTIIYFIISVSSQNENQEWQINTGNDIGFVEGRQNKPIIKKNSNYRQQQYHKNNKHNYVIVDIPELGKVKGFKTGKTNWSEQEFIKFFDIKYGESTRGRRRFKAPVPVKPWKNIRNAGYVGKGCPSIENMADISKGDLNRDIEDCLGLTIYTKSLNNELPVMVYLHGEFLFQGSPKEASPGYLLEKDVVLVSIGYRLGPFGFLSTMSSRIPGNAGILDVILALQWIQKNIHAFGGDSNSVTLFGQVGGAAIANVLTMSPMVTDGLFHRVIYQSGSALTPALFTDNPIKFTKDIGREGGCKNIEFMEQLNKCLIKMNAIRLLKAFRRHVIRNSVKGIGNFGGFQIVIGGPSQVLPEHPGQLIANNKINYYPTMGGVVKNAGTYTMRDIFQNSFGGTMPDNIFSARDYINYVIMYTNGNDSRDNWSSYVESNFFSRKQLINGTFTTLIHGLIDMSGTIPFKNPVFLSLQANAIQMPNQTYVYSFNYEGEYNRYQFNNEHTDNIIPFNLGVSLADENIYLFPLPRLNKHDKRIAKRMVDLWTSFAINGIPTSSLLPIWPPMTDSTGPYMRIDRVSSIQSDFLVEYTATIIDNQNGLSMLSEEYFENFPIITDENGQQEEDNEQQEDEDEIDEEEQEVPEKDSDNNYEFSASVDLLQHTEKSDENFQ